MTLWRKNNLYGAFVGSGRFAAPQLFSNEVVILNASEESQVYGDPSFTQDNQTLKILK